MNSGNNMSTGIININIAGRKPEKGLVSSTSVESTQTVTRSSCSDTSESKQRLVARSNENEVDSTSESPRRKKPKPMTDEFEARSKGHKASENDDNEDENDIDDDDNNDDDKNDLEDENNEGSDDDDDDDDESGSGNENDNNEIDDNEEHDEFYSNEHDNDSEDDDDDDDDDNLLELLRRAAAAQGIPFELLVRQAIENRSDDDDDAPREYPFGTKLPTSLDEIANFILSDKCRNILVLAGAGMSVSAGIPDFRSANGLYATLNPDLLTADAVEKEAIRDDPTVSLELNMFLQNPLPLLELQREFILGTHEQKWKATIAHRFVELLHSKTSKLVRLYTQNIDGLEDQCVQIPRDKIIAVHGSMDRAECELCHSEMDYDNFCEKVRTQIKDLSLKDPKAPTKSTPIICPTCGGTAVKPSIVLFRSSLPRIFFDSVPNDVKDVDLLIVMGTSLRVAPANTLVWRVPRTCLRLLVNREEVGSHLGMNFQDSDDEDNVDEDDGKPVGRDYFAGGECDEVLLQLIDKLGWIDELQPLVDQHKLPDSSSKLLCEYLEKRYTQTIDVGTNTNEVDAAIAC